MAVDRRVAGPTSLCTFCPSLAVKVSMTFHFCDEDNSHFYARDSNHTARDPPRALELRFGGVGSENNCPRQKICHTQELHGGASWRGLMMKTCFFEKCIKSLRNRLRLHTIDTEHTKHAFPLTPALPAALQVWSGGNLVGGLPPGCSPTSLLTFCLPLAVDISVTFDFCDKDN